MSTMIDRGTAIAAAIEVEKYSKQGTELLQSGHLTRAVKAFKYAYKFAGDLDDESMERACAFNLGAAYIAMGQGEKGLNILKYAVPSDDSREGRSNGDLYFNFGLGYESLKNVPEAIRYFNKALEEYRVERDNLDMEIETLLKLAVLYTSTKNNFLMNTYHQLAEAYAMQNKVEKQMWALCEKANTYNSYGDAERAASAADDCFKLSEKCDNTAESGNIFNDLGLLYTQLQKCDKAVKCFEEALPLVQSSDDRKREAVIRQNLGAAYNFVGEYQRAISFHKSAADMYARLQNRNSQGQCYANLAYAYSQIGDIQKAKEAFKHSLLAAEDTDDNRTTWQVSEGLGSVAFSEENFDESIEYFKKALGVLAAKENNITAQNRIVEKLKQALEGQIKDREIERPFSYITKEQYSENPRRAATAKAATEEVAVAGAALLTQSTPDGRVHRRYVPVSKSNSAKRFSKVARGLSDLMEPFVPTPREKEELQGETMRPILSQSEEGSSESESESGSETESESEKEDKKFAATKAVPAKQSASALSRNAETASNRSLRGSESGSSEGETESNSSEASDDEDKKAVHEQMRKYKGESGASGSEDDKDKGNEKTQKKQIVQKEKDIEGSSGESELDSSGSETGSTESDSGEEPPPVPSGSLPKTGPVNTYEQPWSRQNSKQKMNYADIEFESSPKRGPQDEDDPVYQTIPSRTFQDDDVQAKAPSKFADFSSLPRGEQERLMFSKHQHDRHERQQGTTQKPVRGGEKDSKTCALM